MIFFIILAALIWIGFVINGIINDDIILNLIIGLFISITISFFATVMSSAIVSNTNYSYKVVETYNLKEMTENSYLIYDQKKDTYTILIQKGIEVKTMDLSDIRFEKSEVDSFKIVRPVYSKIARCFLFDFLISNNYIVTYKDNLKITTINQIKCN